MRKLIITENDKQNILRMYGLINEQSSPCQFDNYQNGDGVNKPKITINKSSVGVELIYEGPETGFCIQHSKGSTGDSIHQLAGVTRVVVSRYLKELYGNGIYVYPDLKSITMVKKDMFFNINIPFVKTTEDKAITNFNERGGWGHNGISSLNDFKSTISDKNKYGLVSVVTKVASGGNSPDITEHWVSFRDLVAYPIKGGNTLNNLDKKEPIKVNTPDLTTKLSNLDKKETINKSTGDKIVTNYDRAYDYKLTSDNKVMFKGKKWTKYGEKYPEWTDPLSEKGETAIRTKVFKQ